jgi:myo-inositol-1-phosphate synthase
MGTVNVAIVGVGNCASALVQGVAYYANGAGNAVGLAHPSCGGYDVSDVKFTAAFDVDARKIGEDLARAIWMAPNNAFKFAAAPDLGVSVHDGILADGVGAGSADRIRARGQSSLDQIAEHLRRTGSHVVVNLLPTGSQQAAEAYAEAALRAGCGFVNCMPAEIARARTWAEKYAAAGLPLVGDDLKSQFGSTLIHRALIEALADSGVQLGGTYQIVAGGNMDFLNLRDPERITSKQATKVRGFGGSEQQQASEHFGADYIPFLQDRKTAFIRLDGAGFGGTPVEIELRMSVEDSPSAAGNILDAVRLTQRALDEGVVGVVELLSAQFMKAPGVSAAPGSPAGPALG